MKEKLPSVRTSYDKPQHYQRKYCLVCLTGLIGCRWHRYQQSMRDNRKRDLVVFTIIVLCFLHMVVFFYFWLVSRNSIYQIGIYMYPYTKSYFPWCDVGLAVSAVMLAYFTGIVILCLFHVKVGHQLYLHPCHLLTAFLLEVVCIIITILVHIYWPQTWPLTYLSLRVYSPFLQVVAVLVVTALAWLIVRQWIRLTFVYKMAWLPILLVVFVALCIVPFWMSSPVISSTIPEKPGIIAMAGASSVAPENTLYAFRKALDLGVTRIQTTVQISFDGIPFVFHDNTLVRTTDFEEIKNDNISEIPMRNTMSELKMFSAGSWFLQHDPWGSVWSLSENETAEISAEKIPTLSELLDFGADYESLELYLIIQPLPSWHPYCCDPGSLIDHVISESEVWVNRSSNNITTIVTDVNSHWLLSILWCAGVDFVATRHIEDLQDVASPLLHLNVVSYTALWVTVDVLSIIIIIIICVVHRIKIYGTNFSPESISLNTGCTIASYRSRTMKEKLLRDCAAVDSMDELEARDNDGMENRPAYSMLSGHHTYSLSSLIGSRVVTNAGRNMNVVSSLAPDQSEPSVALSINNRYSV
ncbi:unnamed protein product [Candidula unifasciata]|uniref:GP-PDE domain-containing protein n=1 Tax=Candidula unifasciata TaxID=100452 RepID=A0A8S3ZWI9_9EUPU|nr:unnamed protein product [Candidula unifasciata]